MFIEKNYSKDAICIDINKNQMYLWGVYSVTTNNNLAFNLSSSIKRSDILRPEKRLMLRMLKDF
jgi:hypothetical protein